MRERRAFEASLPPGGDVASLLQRRRALEAAEQASWDARAAAIATQQAERLQLLEQVPICQS